MSPTPQPATRRADGADTRRDIVATAHRLFTTIGYRKTTVADIAAELSMSPGNVYRFFDSKRSINEAVADGLLTEIGDELEAIANRPGASAIERLEALLRTLARLSEQRFMTNKRMYDMVEDAMAESWGVCQRYIERVGVILGGLIEEGRASGEFTVADSKAAALCVHSAMVCYSHPAMIAQSAEHEKATIDEIVAFALRGLGADAAL